jgi:DNA polymerase-4
MKEEKIMTNRIIFHIDMNCFFVSCELVMHPEYRGKKVAVAPVTLDRKGIILTASYEAREDGVHSAMRVADALRLCPSLILIPPNMNLYCEFSKKIFSYFSTITPLVEPASIDEGFLDVTDVCDFSQIPELAKTIQNHLLNELQIPCSIGIAPNKFLAKMGSDYKKPLGITIMRKREVQSILWPLPISAMLGVGKKTLEVMKALNIQTIGDFANFKRKDILNQTLGESSANALLSQAYGNGSNVVDINRNNEYASISNSSTFDKDEYNTKNMLLLIHVLSNSVSHRLKECHSKATTFTLEIRYNTFKTITRAMSVSVPTSDENQMYHMYEELFEQNYDMDYPVRLLGVAASKIISCQDEIQQITIFDSLDTLEKEEAIHHLLQSINQNLGKDTIKKGVSQNGSNKKGIDPTIQQNIRNQKKEILK